MTQYTALYYRVSTGDQSTAMQKDDLLNTCTARRWKDIKEYEDVISGAKKERPALDRLIADIKVGRVNRVIVWRFDRMARSALHLLELLDLFNLYSVQFVSLHEGLDSSQPLGRAIITILAAIAELERSTIRTRVKAGIDRAKIHGTKSGKRIGRPRAIFDRKLAEEMSKAGCSQRAIAEKLNVSQAMIWKTLSKGRLA